MSILKLLKTLKRKMQSKLYHTTSSNQRSSSFLICDLNRRFVATPTPRIAVKTANNKVVQKYLGRAVGFIERDLEPTTTDDDCDDWEDVQPEPVSETYHSEVNEETEEK